MTREDAIYWWETVMMQDTRVPIETMLANAGLSFKINEIARRGITRDRAAAFLREWAAALESEGKV